MIKSAYMQAVATYRTIDDFTVGNPITYGIAIVTNNTDYFTEVIGVNSTDIFYSSLGDHDSQASADNLLGLERTPMKDVGYSDLFNFTHNDIFLTANGTITPVAEGEQNVTVLFFSGKHVYDGYYELRPLPISSGLSKLQAETNRSLQKEIAQTNLTNDTVLALTIVVVFAIPIGLAVEYRIERHFYELEKKDNASDSLPRFF
ncbi:MAG TPA: hypothetical protein VEU72_08680 [Nitrosopumilaceae archaeon]|nr:hypothetical protein [Nitrosopumilaceae archaeon]